MAVLGVILAGGQSSRMGGGDKSLLPWAGRTLMRHVVSRLAPQVAGLALNANGDPARFDGFGLPVLPDSVAGQPGPLAGILAAMDWAAAQGAPRVITAAADTPFFPSDLVTRLSAEAAPVVMAASATGRHPVFALWDTALREDLRAALGAGQRRVNGFACDHGVIEVMFDNPDGPDPFFNINTPDDLQQAQEWA